MTAAFQADAFQSNAFESVQDIVLTGIGSSSAVGTLTVAAKYQVTLSGVAPSAAIGTPVVAPQAVTITLGGIAPAAALGTPVVTLTAPTVTLAGIGSTAAVGSPTVTPQAVTITLSGIAPTVALGTPSTVYQITLTGIPPNTYMNRALHSEEVDDAYWTKSNATVIANSAVAPDGTMTMDKLVDNAVNTGHYVARAALWTVGQPGVFSVFAKAAERSWIVLTGSLGAPDFAYFNLATGTIGSVGAGRTAQIQHMGGGIYRCTLITPSAVAGQVRVQMVLGDLNALYVGDGVSGLYLWGLQAELDLVLHPYLKTTTAAVSANNMGALSVTVGAVTISLAGIPSAAAVGSPTVTAIYLITLMGIAAAQGFGTLRVYESFMLDPSIAVLEYRVVISDLTGTPIEEMPFLNLNYSFVLNEPGIASFEIPMDHPKALPATLDPGKREVRIYRHGEVDPVWGGYLWFVGASSDSANLRVQCEGWFSRLMRRVVQDDVSWQNTEQLDIAWGLIAYTQGKESLGLVRDPAEVPSGITRTRKFRSWNALNIGQVLRDMTSMKNGFDFEISPNKEWRAYYPRKQADDGFVFELGKNIKNITADKDATDVVTDLTGMGSGNGRDRCVYPHINVAAVSEYGLLQDSIDLSHIRYYSNLVDATKEEYRLRKKARFQPVIVARLGDPDLGDFGVGDLIRVKAQRGYIDINQKFRLVAINVAVSSEGEEDVSLTFDQDLVEEV